MSDKNPLEKKASVLDTFKAVAASFFGVRSSKALAGGATKLNPVHVILAGLVMAGLFIFTLISVVRWVVK
jgi:Protein of unknown function (DUF2970)